MPNPIAGSDFLQIISFITNIVFVTYGATTFFQGRKHKKELANLFNSEYKTASALAGSTEDPHLKLQIGHLAEFLKAATRNLTNRLYDEVGGDHHNFVMRWLENYIENKKVKTHNAN